MVLRSMLPKMEQRRSPSQMAQLRLSQGSDLVRPETDADRYTPKGQDVPVKQGETPKAEDGIANKGGFT